MHVNLFLIHSFIYSFVRFLLLSLPCTRISNSCSDSVSSLDFLSVCDLYRLLFVSCQKWSYLHLRLTEQKQEKPAGPDTETHRNTSFSSVILIHQLFFTFFYLHPQPKQSPYFHSSAEKEHPLVVGPVAFPPLPMFCYSSLQTVKMWSLFDSAHFCRIISSSARCWLSDQFWFWPRWQILICWGFHSCKYSAIC